MELRNLIELFFNFLPFFLIGMASTGPIENLYVSIEADISKLLRQTSEGVDRIERDLDDMSKEGKHAFDSTGRAAQEAGKQFAWATVKLNALKDALVNLARRAARAITSLGKSVISISSEFESLTVQFTTLLGSEEAAQKRLEELTEFAVKTPFELGDIVEASRVLQVFGGTALATGDNLTMVGDIAAGVGRNFAEVGLWVGRAYDALQNGRPFGLAGMALQRMGALTGAARNELERMQEQGVAGEEMWQRFIELVGTRFTGNMDRLSATFQGVTSNIIDFATNVIRFSGQPFFDVIRDSAARLLDILNRNEPQIRRLASAFAEMAGSVADLITTRFLDRLEDLDYEEIITLVDSMMQLVDSARLLSDILSTLAFGQSFIDELIWVVEKIGEALYVAAQLSAIASAQIARREAERTAREQMELTVAGLGGAEIPLRQMTAEDEARIAAAGQEAFNQVILESLGAMDEYNRRQEERAERAEEATKATDDDTQATMDNTQAQAENADELKKVANALAIDLIDAREENQRDLEELEQKHADRLLDIDRKLADELAELEADTAERRADIFEKARRSLADLAEDTDRKLQEERTDFQAEERRDTEDHLRDMRRMTEDYLFALEDAVKERDARAVVDLQRRFNQEQRRAEEDFTTRQGREREDASQRLAEIRENEAQRRQEILNAQAEQLNDLVQNEARKRAELERSATEQREKEMQNYRERQAELEAALGERLAAIAKELSDEDTINEEGARKILETLNQYFGVGGDIDQLMEDFASRRRQRMTIQIAFEEPETTTTSPSRGTRARQRGAYRFQQGGAMVARKPTLALFGEVPELATFTPLSRLNQDSEMRPRKIQIEFSGTAPPGIRSTERDQIASIVLSAIRETGALNR